MPHIEKKSSIRAKSLQGLKDILSAHSSKGMKGQTDSLLGDSGLFMGAAKGLTKKLNKNLGEKMESGLNKTKSKFVDWDIKGGEKIYNKFGEKSKLKNIFVDKKKFKVQDTPNGPDKYVEVDVPGVTTPLSKLKNAALPTIGGMWVASKMYGNENKQKGGDDKLASKKELAIQKIASQLGQNIETEDLADEYCPGEINISKIAMVAGKVLRQVAKNQRKLEEELDKLRSQNIELKKEAEFNDRYLKSEKVANMMNEKGILKKADVDKQIQQLIEMDEYGFGVFKQAVEDAPDSFTGEGVDNLTFLGSNSNIYSRDRKKTLADSLKSPAHE